MRLRESNIQPRSAGSGVLVAGLIALLAVALAPVAKGAAPDRSRVTIAVTTIRDRGPGSLRAALEQANGSGKQHRISFDSVNGPFATPQTIELESALPALAGDLIIDGYIEGRLWKASGVTISARAGRRAFSVAPGAKATLASLTIANGRAGSGAGIVNRGDLVVKGVTLMGNRAQQDGGGIANLGGRLAVINSTFVENTAGRAGGGLADITGRVSVTHCTFAGNSAQRGGGLFSSGELLLGNSILADSLDGIDCVATGALLEASTHNLIETTQGCGDPITRADPRLEILGSYNGPTPTRPLGGGSPAINMGDNASAVDEHGEPLRWDQRGNGDPRVVGGITDIGAYERQELPALVIDTLEDSEVRACSRGARGDCSLRGAIHLVNAAGNPAVITFDERVFPVATTLVLTRPLPDVEVDLILDAANIGAVSISGRLISGRLIGLHATASGRLTLRGVVLDGAP